MKTKMKNKNANKKNHICVINKFFSGLIRLNITIIKS